VQRLTGGDLIARNMSFIALFRGNDFLPAEVKSTLEEKDRTAMSLLEDEERARLAGFHNAAGVVDAPLKPRYLQLDELIHSMGIIYYLEVTVAFVLLSGVL
jgi:hypothetical protein